MSFGLHKVHSQPVSLRPLQHGLCAIPNSRCNPLPGSGEDGTGQNTPNPSTALLSGPTPIPVGNHLSAACRDRTLLTHGVPAILAPAAGSETGRAAPTIPARSPSRKVSPLAEEWLRRVVNGHVKFGDI